MDLMLRTSFNFFKFEVTELTKKDEMQGKIARATGVYK